MIIDKINESFISASLNDCYGFGEDFTGKYRIMTDRSERISISGITSPYKAEDVLEVEVEKGKKSQQVRVMFTDGLTLMFRKSGIVLREEGLEYRYTNAVLWRLYYKYKTKVCGFHLNPLVIVKNEVVVYCGNASYVGVPEGVIKLGEGAFENSGIERIRLPRSLNEISDYCFRNCKSLEKLIFDSQEDYIGFEVIHEHTKKSKMVFPEHITKIGEHAFYGSNYEL